MNKNTCQEERAATKTQANPFLGPRAPLDRLTRHTPPGPNPEWPRALRPRVDWPPPPPPRPPKRPLTAGRSTIEPPPGAAATHQALRVSSAGRGYSPGGQTPVLSRRGSFMGVTFNKQAFWGATAGGGATLTPAGIEFGMRSGWAILPGVGWALAEANYRNGRRHLRGDVSRGHGPKGHLQMSLARSPTKSRATARPRGILWRVHLSAVPPDRRPARPRGCVSFVANALGCSTAQLVSLTLIEWETSPAGCAG